MTHMNRRRVLRGILNGGVVTVGLPLLDCFLNTNGTAMADGKPLPVAFGTWHWGLGIAKSAFVPKKTGLNYDLTEQLKPLEGVKQHVNVLTNFTAFRDAAPAICHHTGWVIARSGNAPKTNGDVVETVDVTTSARIGRTTRFKILAASAVNNVRETFSYDNPTTPNTAETSALGLYMRIFGPDFQDPNAPTFSPNPAVMVRKSALSGVINDIKDIEKVVGSEDKARMDQYFTAVRQVEQQFEQRLTKPEPIAACHAPKALGEDIKIGTEVELVSSRHKAMASLVAMAVACDQTRVFNLYYGGFDHTKLGYEKPHHACTHEEPIDEKLGYQINHAWFTMRSMQAWAEYVKVLADFKEGGGSLLDRVLVMGTTDVAEARVHSIDNMPLLLAGRAGGKVKTGYHVDGGGTSIARVGYTAMRVMGVDIPSWGTNSNNTSKELGEILV